MHPWSADVKEVPNGVSPPHCDDGVSPPKYLYNRYAVQREMFGKGAFGCVYRGYDVLTKERVAIKHLCGSNPSDLESEVRALVVMAGAQHVIGFRNCGVAQPQILVMEAATGGDVYEIISRTEHGRFREGEAKHLIAQMLAGVMEMHQRGVAHCDLKLENAVLDANGILKWVDFGLAHVHAPNTPGGDDCHALVGGGGSLCYMAPELQKFSTEGSSKRDSKAKEAPTPYNGFSGDMWSLGVCFFAMLTGSFPFKVANESERSYVSVKAAQATGRSTLDSITRYYRWHGKSGLISSFSPEMTWLIDSLLTIDPTQSPSAKHALATYCPAPARPPSPMLDCMETDISSPPMLHGESINGMQSPTLAPTDTPRSYPKEDANMGNETPELKTLSAQNTAPSADASPAATERRSFSPRAVHQIRAAEASQLALPKHLAKAIIDGCPDATCVDLKRPRASFELPLAHTLGLGCLRRRKGA